ncbi:MAG: 16S rRNA (cytidine(1402)-2'-O)-methyltransferase [Chloroflexi bacterium]|nr:16S rRNA (cytidine(1402)-2'-O)-methyltransferase [Chloroflexota bacterium]
MPTLYVVATPIGNLEDTTLRALRVLREVRLIAAEDTRTAKKLLSHFGLHTPLTSYHEHNKRAKLPALLKALQEHDVALVSEAGTPGISDPGYELVRSALESGINVVAVPGPSVVTTALAVSGLPAGQFTFVGFLPRRPSARRKALQSLAQEPRTLVLFEAPHRLFDSLGDIAAILGDRRLAVCRELTKLYEEVFRGTVTEALAHFRQPLGEFTLVIEGAPEASDREEAGEEALQQLRRLRRQGQRAQEAVPLVASATGLSRREVYKLWLQSR